MNPVIALSNHCYTLTTLGELTVGVDRLDELAEDSHSRAVTVHGAVQTSFSSLPAARAGSEHWSRKHSLYVTVRPPLPAHPLPDGEAPVPPLPQPALVTLFSQIPKIWSGSRSSRTNEEMPDDGIGSFAALIPLARAALCHTESKKLEIGIHFATDGLAGFTVPDVFASLDQSLKGPLPFTASRPKSKVFHHFSPSITLRGRRIAGRAFGKLEWRCSICQACSRREETGEELQTVQIADCVDGQCCSRGVHCKRTQLAKGCLNPNQPKRECAPRGREGEQGEGGGVGGGAGGGRGAAQHTGSFPIERKRHDGATATSAASKESPPKSDNREILVPRYARFHHDLRKSGFARRWSGAKLTFLTTSLDWGEAGYGAVRVQRFGVESLVNAIEETRSGKLPEGGKLKGYRGILVYSLVGYFTGMCIANPVFFDYALLPLLAILDY
ncbi:hypothetical protein BDK51DRAFT_28480 [Blyttiomyces helicus]|uniref:Uncharacterized protein n=1 Tax=Blyttiomyces helicus TaxID=388810 RepID=A0A4P9WF83_9FUNG|nr:hypothetical protein BDK51DRAFT_28480 [Blyttiomyces helicus]|eukprot:RKO91399.1 hypothetical protein BDK51DRAFT_28480 [Blyttiomyces helicus]